MRLTECGGIHHSLVLIFMVTKLHSRSAIVCVCLCVMWSSKSYAQIWLPLAIIIKPEGKQRHTHTHTHSLRPVQSNQNYYTLDDWLFSIWHSVVFYISEVLLCRTDIWLMINESACTNVYGCARRTPVPFRVGSMWAYDSILNTIILLYKQHVTAIVALCIWCACEHVAVAV